MDTCEHEGCPEPRGGKRSPFCPEHKAAHRRAWNRDRMRRKREEEAADKVLGVTAVSDGRSIPRSPDSWTPPTQHHPSRRFGRRDEPELVDFTKPGATARQSAFDRPAPRTDLQRYRPVTIEADSWTSDDEAGYYDGIDWRSRNDKGQGPFGGYNHSGTPVQFLVVRRSR